MTDPMEELRELSLRATRGTWVAGYEDGVLANWNDDVIGRLRDPDDVLFAAAAVNFVRTLLKARTTDELADEETLEFMREGLLQQISAYSEDHWAAGWMNGIDRDLHRAGGMWEILGRQLGWPLGYRGDQGWVSWDEATTYYLDNRPEGLI